MRVIQLLVPERVRDDVVAFLRDEEIDFVLTEDSLSANGGDDGNAALVQFPLPTEAVEFVLDGLRERGIRREDYTVIITGETATTKNYATLEERFIGDQEDDDSIAREEIRAKALGMNPGRGTYYAMTVLSAFVATAGLLLDSPAVVVGSMVIAPQVGSSLTTSVGAVLNDRRMIRDGLVSQLLGLALAVVGAAGLGWALKTAEFVPAILDLTTVSQISERISPGLLSLAVGVCAGAAGAFGLATALPVSLVGVMIAAALIPAAAAVGIGVAWGLPLVALGAFVLLVINAVSINVAGLATLWHLGYRPDGWTDGGLRANFDPHRFAPVIGLFAVLLVAFAAAGVVMGNHVVFENEVNRAVEDTLAEEEYGGVDLLKVQVEFDDMDFLGATQEVTVAVSRPADERHPDLAADIRERISREAGRDVVVSVEFTEHRRSPSR